jgi:hypothetical protein
MVFIERFKPELMINFLEKLFKQMKKKVFFITNEHPVHRSRAVKELLAEKTEVRLFELPG